MIKRNRQRNVPYLMPVKKDVTRFYMKVASKVNFYGWTIRNCHKTIQTPQDTILNKYFYINKGEVVS